MPMPSVVPTFATDSNYDAGPNVWNGQPNKSEPSPELFAQGFVPNVKPTAEELNWLLNDIGQWLDWLSDSPDLTVTDLHVAGNLLVDGTSTFTGIATFSNDVHVAAGKNIVLTGTTSHVAHGTRSVEHAVILADIASTQTTVPGQTHGTPGVSFTGSGEAYVRLQPLSDNWERINQITLVGSQTGAIAVTLWTKNLSGSAYAAIPNTGGPGTFSGGTCTLTITTPIPGNLPLFAKIVIGTGNVALKSYIHNFDSPEAF